MNVECGYMLLNLQCTSFLPLVVPPNVHTCIALLCLAVYCNNGYIAEIQCDS